MYLEEDVKDKLLLSAWVWLFLKAAEGAEGAEGIYTVTHASDDDFESTKPGDLYAHHEELGVLCCRFSSCLRVNLCVFSLSLAPFCFLPVGFGGEYNECHPHGQPW